MTVTSSGIPVTVSRMMIKYKSEGNIFRSNGTISAGILISIITCIPLVLLVFSKSKLLNFLFSDERCLLILMIMIPGLIFTSVYAVIRGTFWGNKQFLPYSIIEFAEEGVMLIVGIILVNKATGMLDGVKKAGVAVLVSYVFSFSISLITFFAKGGRLNSPIKEIKPLLTSSAPITTTKMATSLINTLVAIILPARLVRYGISSSDAVSQFGTVFGMAFPLISMPSTIIGSLALVLVPELSSALYSKNFSNLKNNIEKALKFACIIACILIPVFLSTGKQIGELIYSNSLAGEYTVKGCITMLPLSIVIISTSMLNSLNKEKRTLLSFFIGASAMILSILFLPAIIGIDSLIVGILLNYLISSIVNVISLYKSCPLKVNFTTYLIKATTLTIPTTIFGYFLKNVLIIQLGFVLGTILSIGITACFSLVLNGIFGMYNFIFDKTLYVNFFKKRYTLYYRQQHK